MSFVQMTHPGISGEVSTTLEAFNGVWDSLGWVLSEPGGDAVYLPAPLRLLPGEWLDGTVYSPGDVVSYADSLWVAVEPSVGDEPGVDPEWVPVGGAGGGGGPAVMPLTGTQTTTTRKYVFQLQPSSAGVGSFSAGMAATLFNSTLDYVWDIGYNPRRAVTTEHSMTLTHEQNYEVSPGVHWCETYYEYTNKTGAFSFRPWFLVINRDTDAIQTHTFSGSPFTWTTKEGVGIATLAAGGQLKLNGTDPSFEGWADAGHYFQIIGFTNGLHPWRLGGDADYAVSLSVDNIITARFQAFASYGGFLSVGTGAAPAKITARSQHVDNLAGAFMRFSAAQAAPILGVYSHDESTLLWSVNPAGIPRWDLAANQQTTVGAAGAASAPPATPTKYLKVVDSAGTVLVIPAYAAS